MSTQVAIKQLHVCVHLYMDNADRSSLVSFSMSIEIGIWTGLKIYNIYLILLLLFMTPNK